MASALPRSTWRRLTNWRWVSMVTSSAAVTRAGTSATKARRCVSVVRCHRRAGQELVAMSICRLPPRITLRWCVRPCPTLAHACPGMTRIQRNTSAKRMNWQRSACASVDVPAVLAVPPDDALDQQWQQGEQGDRAQRQQHFAVQEQADAEAAALVHGDGVAETGADRG